jgi:hypothetical protein
MHEYFSLTTLLVNISGDSPYQRHPIFVDYVDLASSAPGKDKSWAVGTECRYFKNHFTRLKSGLNPGHVSDLSVGIVALSWRPAPAQCVPSS